MWTYHTYADHTILVSQDGHSFKILGPALDEFTDETNDAEDSLELAQNVVDSMFLDAL